MSKHAIAIARAIGVIGATTAVIVGISYANLSTASSPVKLSPNNLVTDTAALAIGAGTNCPAGDTTATTGFTTATPMLPGGSPVTVNFCLDNKGNIPLTVTASIPSLPTGTAANHTTLSISCTTEGALITNGQTLSSFAASAFTNQIPAGAQDNCTASAALDNGYSGSGGENIPAFDIAFVGNQ